MMECKDIIEKRITKEMEEQVAKEQLHQYGNFLEGYQGLFDNFKEDLTFNSFLHKPIIYIENKAYEELGILDIVKSDNKLLSRILASLGSICEEASYLIEEAKNYFCTILSQYKQDISYISEIDSAGDFIEIMQRLHFYVDRTYEIILLILQQLCALLGKSLYKGATFTCLPELLNNLAELLVCLITLDCILDSATKKKFWFFYCKIIKSALHDPMKFSSSSDNLQDLDESFSRIEAKLLRGKIFQQAMEKCLEENLLMLLKNSSVSNEIYLWMNQILSDLERDNMNIPFAQSWMQINAIFVLYNKLFGSLDKKIYKRLSDINRKNVACILYNNVIWYPDLFLIEHIPALGKTTDIKVLTSNQMIRINLVVQTFHKDFYALYKECSIWIIDMKRLLKKDMYSLREKDLQELCALVMLGLKLMKKVNGITKWILNLHTVERKPITKSLLFALYRLIEVSKAMQFTFQKNSLPLVYTTSLISQHLIYMTRTKLLNIKRSLMQEKSYKEQQLDILSSLDVAESALKGPHTSQRTLVTKLALSASDIPSNLLIELRSMVNCIEVICNTNSIVDDLFDGSFMQWHSTLLPIFLSKIACSRVDISRIDLILDAFEDNIVTDKNKYCKLIEELIQRYLTEPVIQLIEGNLRLQTHMHLQLPPLNPFENVSLPTFKRFLPSKFNNLYINVKQETEHCLSKTFYNLTTVVLHDWRTYGEMRSLAEMQYSLKTVEDELPMQTLEQGLDVLEIMRNMDIFVEKYMYNLNNQVFIEESSNNKYLNTINISHVANSIRSHGIGIMNTAVNFTYQFLQKKFFIFSQFMFDEQIKSRLLKDLKYFMEHRNELRQMYPYERAEKFNVGIRKLGINEEGLSYLDLFRKLITHIGNVMGYVRLIRSGGRRCISKATSFIPDLKEAEEFQKMLESLPECIKEGVADLQQNLGSFVESFEEATEYFKLLLNVFIPTFRNLQNIHLKNFYVIVPPLTINFIQHIVACKEQFTKKNRTFATFTDDGFAMGLAYIIELLDQTSHLNSLNWFHSVQAKINKEYQVIKEQKAKAHREDEKLQQTLSLTEKRLSTFEKEFQLFYFNFNSAKIFFK